MRECVRFHNITWDRLLCIFDFLFVCLICLAKGIMEFDTFYFEKIFKINLNIELHD